MKIVNPEALKKNKNVQAFLQVLSTEFREYSMVCKHLGLPQVEETLVCVELWNTLYQCKNNDEVDVAKVQFYDRLVARYGAERVVKVQEWLQIQRDMNW